MQIYLYLTLKKECFSVFSFFKIVCFEFYGSKAFKEKTETDTCPGHKKPLKNK